jgi:hypothetical protein
MESYIVMECPHCQNLIQIFKNEINCAIFRHGILKVSGQQIGPHSSKIECDNMVLKDLIYGCGKPFRLIKETNNYKIETCDYI